MDPQSAADHHVHTGATVCVVNGAAQSCIQPAQLTVQTRPDAGTVAGPATPDHIPFFGGDRGELSEAERAATRMAGRVGRYSEDV